jgi:serine/threonine protein kinase
VFPHADANLRGYWEKTPLPELSETTLRWSLTQCKGIASGLMAIHEYRTSLGEVTNSPTTPPPHARRFSYNLSPNPLPAENERRYGRHGDIKPENILWTELTDEDDPQGILLIADFGLVDFHGKQTRSEILPETVNGSPSYEPPERRLNIKISRAYDIWSLGCVYLEFITWLVSGWEDLSKFPIVRGKTGSIGINDDTFFTILDERPTRTAIVRESVTEWIKDLHEKPRCSKFIHDFLDLVENDMLVVDTSMRIQCGPLNKRLRQMLEEAEKNPSYLTAPKPTPKRERNEIAEEITKRMTWGYRDTPPAGPTEGSALPTREVPLILDTVAVSRVSSQRSSRRSSSPLPQVSHDVEETALARPQRASTPLPTFSFPDD